MLGLPPSRGCSLVGLNQVIGIALGGQKDMILLHKQFPFVLEKLYFNSLFMYVIIFVHFSPIGFPYYSHIESMKLLLEYGQ